MTTYAAYCANCGEYSAASFRPFYAAAPSNAPLEDLCCDECHFVITTLKGHPHTTLWQPIATAKQEGEILACGGTYYRDDGDGTFEAKGVSLVSWRPGRGWCGGYASEYDVEYWHQPTHWQVVPLPA